MPEIMFSALHRPLHPHLAIIGCQITHHRVQNQENNYLHYTKLSALMVNPERIDQVKAHRGYAKPTQHAWSACMGL